MAAEVKPIPLTLREIEIQIAVENLNRGMLAVMGGEIIAEWILKNKNKVVHIFTNLDECCIQFKDAKGARDFMLTLSKVKFNKTEDLTKYVKWGKPKDSESSLLIFRWE